MRTLEGYILTEALMNRKLLSLPFSLYHRVTITVSDYFTYLSNSFKVMAQSYHLAAAHNAFL